MKKDNIKLASAIVGGAALALGITGASIYFVTRQGTTQSAETSTAIADNTSSASSTTTSQTTSESKNKITSGGTYNYSGTVASGKISVDTTEAVTIVLSNVSITSADGAAIKCQENSNVTIELMGDNTITATNESDGINSEGDLVITGSGSLTIKSDDDGIHADGKLTINSGNITISAHEGLEATYVIINGGTLNITATDDGINAGNKSDKYSVCIEINGGNITIDMGQGDTDAIDSNGDLYINGGTLNITAQSPFDYDGTAKYTGGTMIVNGTQTTTITSQFGGAMGGGQQPAQQPGQQQMPR